MVLSQKQPKVTKMPVTRRQKIPVESPTRMQATQSHIPHKPAKASNHVASEENKHTVLLLVLLVKAEGLERGGAGNQLMAEAALVWVVGSAVIVARVCLLVGVLCVSCAGRLSAVLLLVLVVNWWVFREDFGLLDMFVGC